MGEFSRAEFDALNQQWGGKLTGRTQVVVTDDMARAAAGGISDDVIAAAAEVLIEEEAEQAEADEFSRATFGVPSPNASPSIADLALAWEDGALDRYAERATKNNADAATRATVSRRRAFERRMAEVRASTGGEPSTATRRRLWAEESARVGLSGGDVR